MSLPKIPKPTDYKGESKVISSEEVNLFNNVIDMHAYECELSAYYFLCLQHATKALREIIYLNDCPQASDIAAKAIKSLVDSMK